MVSDINPSFSEATVPEVVTPGKNTACSKGRVSAPGIRRLAWRRLINIPIIRGNDYDDLETNIY
jgi:hypothetical protein